ncbi:hypothetical protein Tco_1159765, partial [Tanacetum coccineum]
EYDDGSDLIDYDFATHGSVGTSFVRLSLKFIRNFESYSWKYRSLALAVLDQSKLNLPSLLVLQFFGREEHVKVKIAEGKVLGGKARRNKSLSPQSMDVHPMI